MSRVLLIDADIIAYRVAAANEQEYDFGDGGVAKVLDSGRVSTDIEDILAGFLDHLNADDFRVCLTDPNNEWRKVFDPTYKAHRDGSKKPELLMATKGYLHREYASSVVPWLEADDVMGIHATNPSQKNEMIIVSEDKDMRTIPAKVYHPHRDELGIMEITKQQADQFLLWQALTGDATDGYPGCPGVGPKSDYALDLMTLKNPLKMWDCVVEAYASKGLTEDDAIHQARLACICRHTNWNLKKRKVRLWNPTHLLY